MFVMLKNVFVKRGYDHNKWYEIQTEPKQWYETITNQPVYNHRIQYNASKASWYNPFSMVLLCISPWACTNLYLNINEWPNRPVCSMFKWKVIAKEFICYRGTQRRCTYMKHVCVYVSSGITIIEYVIYFMGL